ncbi:MAG: hypothetical protein WBW48_23060 [Anaerolineae bacterium]
MNPKVVAGWSLAVSHPGVGTVSLPTVRIHGFIYAFTIPLTVVVVAVNSKVQVGTEAVGD